MQFLYPTFLFALAALAIPIIVHLFHFRRFKKVYFSNVRFLKEVKEETQSRSRLKHLLVLLLRCLAVAFLVLAFAQPFIPQEEDVRAGQQAVGIYVDNSFSMDAITEEAPLLEQARARAREIVQAYAPDDQFQILTNDFEGRHQRMVSQEDALTLLDEIQPSPAVRSLSRVVSRMEQTLNSGTIANKTGYLLSDFQESSSDVAAIKADTSLRINLVPLAAIGQRNVSIDSAWFDAPVQMLGQVAPLIIKVTNRSDREVEAVRVNVQYAGQTRPVGTLDLAPRATAYDTVVLTVQEVGWQQGVVTLKDYPVQFDDRYYFAFEVAEQINILSLNEQQPDRYLTAAFSENAGVTLTNLPARQIDYSTLPTYQLIVLNDVKSLSTGLAFELKQYVENGGNVLVFPAAQADLASYKAFLRSVEANELTTFEATERRAARINTREFVFNDVYENAGQNLQLPVTQGNYKLTRYGSRGEEPLLSYRDGSTLVGKYRFGKGHLYLSAAPLATDYGNLSRSPEVFVPMVYKMALSSGDRAAIAYTIGRDEVLEADNRIDGAETVYQMRKGDDEFIPEQKALGARVVIGTGGQVQTDGVYDLRLRNSTEITRKFAFNYDRLESDLDYLTVSQLREAAPQGVSIIDATARADFGELVAERSRGITLWKWCLILALIFLAAEVLVLRFWKT